MSIANLAIPCTLTRAELEVFIKLEDGVMNFTNAVGNGAKRNTLLSPNAPTVLIDGRRYTTASIKTILGYSSESFLGSKSKGNKVSSNSSLSSSFTVERTLSDPAITIFKSESMFALLFEDTLTLHKSTCVMYGLTFKHNADKVSAFKLTEL